MNVKITELPLADALTGAEAIPIVQDGITKQTTTGDLLPPYKVFTGLLTQSGGDDPQTISDGLVTKGVTYQIQGDDGNFLNVGAPNNNDGTYFIAINNEQPTDYGTSLLNYNNGAPVCTILENTLGNVWFTYYDDGKYYFNSNGLFANNKTWTNPTSNDNGSIQFQMFRINDNQCRIIDISGSNNGMVNTSIEIRVYN
tara:strand:+ start:1979 stop:2572 length:594 start_codon:yes stop_codon:yes gene_type:complete